MSPAGIGLRDPRSQKRDLGHPSISPFDFGEGSLSREASIVWLDLEAGRQAKPPAASRRDRVSGEEAVKVNDIETVIQIIAVELQARVQFFALVDIQA
jgi:hypothetical protein